MVQYSLFMQIFIIHISFMTTSSTGIKCPGYCTKDLKKCRGKGGKIIGYCTNALACCDPMLVVTGSCGDTKYAQRTVFFKSPDFPDFARGDLNCEFNVKLLEDTVGVRIAFITGEMDGMSYLRSEADGGNCESDMIFYRGFGTWAPPPLCGNLTGYVSLIDKFSEVSRDLKTLTVVALMSSLSYRWHIQITQISEQQFTKNETLKAKEIASDYEDVSIMEEDKNTYRYRRSLNINESVLEESLDTTTEILTSSSTDISTSTEIETQEYSTPILTTASPAETSTAEMLPEPSKLEQGREEANNETLNQFQQKDTYEKPEHRFEIPLIVNGQDTEVNQVPWQASVRIKPSVNKIESKSVNENVTLQPLTDVDSNEIDNNTAQLHLGSSASLNGTKYDEDVNESSITHDNCSESEGYHFCGGVLIGDNLILSAAHCFFGNSKNEGMTSIGTIEVVLGDTNLCTDESKQEILPSYSYDVESIYIHYAYDPHLLINDIALLKLKKNVTLAENVQRINLADTGANFTYKEALISGWGDTNLTSSDDTSPFVLQSAMDFRIQNQSYCNDKDLEQYTDTKEAILKHPKYQYVFQSTICTLGTKDNKSFEISSGKGDSGGGLIVFNNFGDPVLAGIVSYGVVSSEKSDTIGNEEHVDKDTRSKILDYFTSVAFYRKWINLAML